ncbi:MAG: hypothetical protein QM770_01970 [Tepidisphaeraceae bacterium]
MSTPQRQAVPRSVVTFTSAGPRSRLHIHKEAVMAAKSAPKSSAPAASDPPAKANGETANRPPVHAIRYRNLKVAVWKNESSNGPFYSVTATRSYQDEREDWHDVTSFNFDDLPLLAKALNDAHSWIAWQERRTAAES